MEEIVLDIPGKSAGVERVARTPSALPEGRLDGHRLLHRTPWAFYMSLGFISTGLFMLPALYLWYFDVRKKGAWYEVLQTSPLKMEAFRWSILSSLFVFVFSVSMVACMLAPIGTKYGSPQWRSVGAAVGGLRIPLAFFIASTAMLLLYVTCNFDVELSVESLLSGPAEPSSFLDRMFVAPIMTILSALGGHVLAYKEQLRHVPVTAVIFSSVVLLEKLLLLNISAAFHRNFYTKRILNNNLVLSCVELLTRRFPAKREKPVQAGALLTETQIEKYSESIFAGMCEEGHTSLALEDFMAVMEHPDALRFMDYLDANQSGDVTLEELKEALKEAYDEKCNLLRSLKANESVISKIDAFLLTVSLLVLAAFCLPNMQGSILGFVAFVGGSAWALNFAFKHIIDQVFNSIIFVLLTHPYDVGDKIHYAGKNYRVAELGFWMTTLSLPSGRIVYVPNHKLVQDVFGNYRRSDPQDDTVVLSMSPTVSKDQIEKLMGAVNAFIRSRHRIFSGPSLIKLVTIDNRDVMHVGISLKHQFNFNNDDLYNQRREVFSRAVQDIAREQDLALLSTRFK